MLQIKNWKPASRIAPEKHAILSTGYKRGLTIEAGGTKYSWIVLNIIIEIASVTI